MIGVEPGIAHQALIGRGWLARRSRPRPRASRRSPEAGTVASCRRSRLAGVGMPSGGSDRPARQRWRPRRRRSGPRAAAPRTTTIASSVAHHDRQLEPSLATVATDRGSRIVAGERRLRSLHAGQTLHERLELGISRWSTSSIFVDTCRKRSTGVFAAQTRDRSRRLRRYDEENGGETFAVSLEAERTNAMFEDLAAQLGDRRDQ